MNKKLTSNKNINKEKEGYNKINQSKLTLSYLIKNIVIRNNKPVFLQKDKLFTKFKLKHKFNHIDNNIYQVNKNKYKINYKNVYNKCNNKRTVSLNSPVNNKKNNFNSTYELILHKNNSEINKILNNKYRKIKS